MTRGPKQPTCTIKVERVLHDALDFMTAAEVARAAAVTFNQAGAALYHLRKYRAAEALNVEGRILWIGTPESDIRLLVVEERTPEDKPRRTRRTRKVTP